MRKVQESWAGEMLKIRTEDTRKNSMDGTYKTFNMSLLNE